jgi:hypothetical protein
MPKFPLRRISPVSQCFEKIVSETNYLLYFASRRNIIKQIKLSELESICEEISKMLNALAKSIRKRKESLNTWRSALNTKN